jgi:SAM-dependent methyltransferase
MLPLVEPLAPCPACAAADPAPLHVVRNHDAILAAPFYAILACRACGLIYVGPRPDPERMARFYAVGGDEHDAWHAGKGTAQATEQWRLNKLGGATKKIKRLLKAFPDLSGVAFDFGCGVGVLLDALKARGWETVGLEPHPIGQVAGQRHRMVTEIPATPSFDLVIAHHVLEHLLEPAVTLRQLHAATRPGGVAFVSVPSADTLPEHGDLHYVSNPIHMNGFTTPSLTNLLRLTGWDVVTTQQQVKKLQAYARRVEGPLPLLPGGFDAAMAVMRAYARQVNVDGRFEGAGVSPASR